ncbi:hypothetical protein HFN20_09060 [Paenibacillus dendritiformis]|uniref:hypothetical protein n=1 Tax=Paenibacillus dendritiformis TaxID=130049 RepID=UPI00143DF175|nr:hypothetical protein [Paenibacillus dendritiformis]NKI21370.1 hypothetical protein [Paenibacillus dendritiformis]NRG00335.1 hypothetical protein [Paenibacillus dendritiformis]
MNRLQEVDYGSDAQESYSYDPAGNRIRRVLNGLGNAYYYLNNQHGDVVHITNRLGGIVNSYESDAFVRGKRECLWQG